MKSMKLTFSALLVALGITSMTGCFYYRHDTDHTYRDRDLSYHSDRSWHDRYAYAPRHWDWDHD